MGYSNPRSFQEAPGMLLFPLCPPLNLALWHSVAQYLDGEIIRVGGSTAQAAQGCLQLNYKQASFVRSCPIEAGPPGFTSSGLGRALLNSKVVYFVMLECYPKARLLRQSSYLGFGHPFLRFIPKK